MKPSEPHSQNFKISVQFTLPKRPWQSSQGYIQNTLTAASTHAAVTLGNIWYWTAVPSLTVTNLDVTITASQEKDFSTYRLSLASSHSSSTRPPQRRWNTDTNTVRQEELRMLLMSSTVHTIRSSARRKSLRMGRNIPISTSRIAEILRSGCPLMVSPHSNVGAIQRGWLFYSTTTFCHRGIFFAFFGHFSTLVIFISPFFPTYLMHFPS